MGISAQDLQQIPTIGDLKKFEEALIAKVTALVKPAILQQEEMLTVEEIAAKLKFNRNTVTKWITEGKKDRHGRMVKLEAGVYGGFYRIKPSDLEAFGKVGLEE